ncbi:MAG: hypothetical protein V4490_00090 [Pseudomonadota bacterium]
MFIVIWTLTFAIIECFAFGSFRNPRPTPARAFFYTFIILLVGSFLTYLFAGPVPDNFIYYAPGASFLVAGALTALHCFFNWLETTSKKLKTKKSVASDITN